MDFSAERPRFDHTAMRWWKLERMDNVPIVFWGRDIVPYGWNQSSPDGLPDSDGRVHTHGRSAIYGTTEQHALAPWFGARLFETATGRKVMYVATVPVPRSNEWASVKRVILEPENLTTAMIVQLCGYEMTDAARGIIAGLGREDVERL